MNKQTLNKIKDVCRVGDGAHASIDRVSTGVLYLTSKNFQPTGLSLTDVEYISENDYKKHFNQRSTAITKPQKNDILLSIIGSLGSSYVVKESDAFGLSSSVAILRPNLEVNSNYLHYWLMSPFFQKSVLAIKSGVAQSYLSLEMIKSLPVSVPTISTQEDIASILSAYDELNDTNRRRIQLLEEAARLLFREWFVYFKFPNHEKVKIVDRDGRKIPAEWDYLPFTKINLFKKAPLGVPVFTDIRQYCQTSEIDGTSITGTGEEVDYENRPSRADIAPRINTVYFAKMKDTDKVLYFNKGNSDLLEKLLLSTGMVGFTTDGKYLGFLFGLLTSYEFVQYKNNFATGATQVSLNDASLKKIKVLFPALNLVELYSEIVNPLLEECSLLRSQNQKLAQTRDLLLPKLMKGEIRA